MITIWVAVVGLCIGSFANVVIARLPIEDDLDVPDPGDSWWAGWKLTFRLMGRSVKRLSWPPSRCPKCAHQIRWYENIPVISWLALRGKCSNCKTPISPRYIFVELLTGALFVAAVSRFGLNWELVSALVFFLFLVPLIFIDAEHWILPFELTIPGLVFGIALAIPRGLDAVRMAIVGAVVAFCAFRFLEFAGWFMTSFRYTNKQGIERRVGRETLGMGDKYLLAMIGAQVGWRALLGVILFSSLQASFIGVYNLWFRGAAKPDDSKERPAESPIARWWRTPKIKGRWKLGLLWRRRQAMKRLAYWGPDEIDETLYLPFTPWFLETRLPMWKRLVLVPLTIFFQDVPDSPPADETTGEVPDWTPKENNLPYGPWLGLAGIQIMLLGPWIVEHLLNTPWHLVAEVMFGQ